MEWEAQIGKSMVDTNPLSKLLWVYCPGHAGVKGNDRAYRLAGKASGLLLGISEMLKSLRQYMQTQSQGHHTIDRLTQLERRGKSASQDDLP